MDGTTSARMLEEKERLAGRMSELGQGAAVAALINGAATTGGDAQELEAARCHGLPFLSGRDTSHLAKA